MKLIYRCTNVQMQTKINSTNVYVVEDCSKCQSSPAPNLKQMCSLLNSWENVLLSFCKSNILREG